MQVFSRWELVSTVQPCGGPALLLEGDWPDASVGNRWSLDTAIDARHEWIDCEAERITAALADGSTSHNSRLSRDLRLFAHLNARDLRYFLVKHLRIVAFFERCWRGPLPEQVCLHVTRGRDQDYAALFERLANQRGFSLDVHWLDATPAPAAMFPPNRLWRQIGGRLALHFDPRLPARCNRQPRVILCGNRRFLDPVCDELLRRAARVWWLYDRFSVGAWLRWRGRGVGQLVCNTSQGKLNRFAAVDQQLPDHAAGMLGPPLADWFRRMSRTHGARQTRMIEQIGAYFDQVRPTLLIMDEDATPLPRAAIAAARSHGAASVVVQHGAPCVRFGFTPLAADRICVWGDSSRRQLIHWGVDQSRICVTGRCSHHAPRDERRARHANRDGYIAPKHILLLATTPARDERPDAVGFHLTRRTHDEMLRVAFACAARIPRVRLTIKLHPRARDAARFKELLRRFPTLPVNVVRGSRLDRLVRRADCVLSCASSSGVEAAAAGVPVIQLLPLGSGDILPAEEWGFLGSARTESELDELLGTALSSRHTPCAVTVFDSRSVFHDPLRAAQRIVDAALSTGTACEPHFNPASGNGIVCVQAAAHITEPTA